RPSNRYLSSFSFLQVAVGRLLLLLAASYPDLPTATAPPMAGPETSMPDTCFLLFRPRASCLTSPFPPHHTRGSYPLATMPRQEPVRVPTDEIRRTLEDLDRRRTQNSARGRQGNSQSTVPNCSTSQKAAKRRQELIRVPHDEILRMLHHLDRQHAEDRARQRAGETDQIHRPTTPSPKRLREQEALPTPPPTQPSRPPKRRRSMGATLPTPPGTQPNRSPKRPRPMRETVRLQQESVKSILQYRESCFRDKEEASATRSWCKEVPLARQVEASKSFYQAFTDEKTLPISHCVFCYIKHAPCELTTIQWKRQLTPSLLQATRTLQQCGKCLPLDDDTGVHVCVECRAGLEGGKLPKACSVNNMDIGCDHRYPEELDGLSPVEERLIALQAPFGYITKFTVDNKTPSGLSYRKHVKGHIVVFPNKVEDLVATVLPHPLLETIENIHVSWSGSSKPGPADVGNLLQVRKSRVRTALSWLQRNNPLYEHVTINHGEIDGWRYADGSNVPILIMDSMRREEPSAAEKTQTDHIVPDTDRGLEDNRSTSIEELLNSVHDHSSDDPSRMEDHPSTEQHHTSPGGPSIAAPAPGPSDGSGDAVYETSSSGMFPLDGPAAFEEADKLSFLAGVMPTSQSRQGEDSEPCAIQVQTTGEQPFIRVERGADFADSLHEDFFPRTFPKLFPWGRGGPKALRGSDRDLQHASEPVERQANHSLNYWARYVL
ncbi:hypothetical protein B0J13DRAFT_201943, partial [Dactylonectria estremocensis]